MSEGIETAAPNGIGARLDEAGERPTPTRRPAERIRARAGKVIGTAEGLARSTLGESAARTVREKGEAAVDTVQDAVDRAASRVELAVTRDPYKALAIALGVGLGLGLMLGRRTHTIIYRPIRE